MILRIDLWKEGVIELELTVGDAERGAREVNVLPRLLHDKREDGVHLVEGRVVRILHLGVRLCNNIVISVVISVITIVY